MPKLNIKVFALSCGFAWSAAMLILGLVSHYTGLGAKIVSLLSNLYLGYQSTFLGSLFGAIWGFVDALILGVAAAWIYNRFIEARGIR